MCVKVIVIVANAWAHGEIRGRHTPTGVWVEQSPTRPPIKDLRWYVVTVSRPKVYLNA